MLKRLGIENSLQLVITLCVIALIVVTTLGSSGGAPSVFFTYRTLLLLIAVLCAVGSRQSSMRISPVFVGLLAVLFSLMAISVLRIPGSHFDASYLWYRYAFFTCAFLSLAHYARYQSARWKGLLLGTVIIVGLAYLLPDLVRRQDRIYGFSLINGDYFATYLLIGFGISIGTAIFAINRPGRILCSIAAAVFMFGIIRTASRGAVLASIAICTVAAIRARDRIPRQVWLAAALIGLLAAVIFSPPLIFKFLDRGQSDPYNYARIFIWKSSLQVIAQQPLLGIGFGQFIHVSKRFSFPMEGQVARYLKRIGMAHSEYLQHMAELGIPAALLLFFLLGYLVYLAWKHSESALPENRCFHEAAILAALAAGLHALVDNCWTIPVTAASLMVLALADPLPLCPAKTPERRRALKVALISAMVILIYLQSVVIPGAGLYYNERGHSAYDRGDLQEAEQFHRKAIQIIPNQPTFLDNLGMVYLDQFLRTQDPHLLELAREHFELAIAASPRALEPRLHMETVLVRSLTDDPAHNLSLHKAILDNDARLLEIDPYLPFPRKNMAGAYYVLGEKDRAMEELQRAINYEPNYVPAYLVMASWYAERGEISQSRRYETAGISIVNKYRDFTPKELYERILLGRPERAPANTQYP